MYTRICNILRIYINSFVINPIIPRNTLKLRVVREILSLTLRQAISTCCGWLLYEETSEENRGWKSIKNKLKTLKTRAFCLKESGT